MDLPLTVIVSAAAGLNLLAIAASAILARASTAWAGYLAGSVIRVLGLLTGLILWFSWPRPFDLPADRREGLGISFMFLMLGGLVAAVIIDILRARRGTGNG